MTSRSQQSKDPLPDRPMVCDSGAPRTASHAVPVKKKKLTDPSIKQNCCNDHPAMVASHQNMHDQSVDPTVQGGKRKKKKKNHLQPQQQPTSHQSQQNQNMKLPMEAVEKMLSTFNAIGQNMTRSGVRSLTDPVLDGKTKQTSDDIWYKNDIEERQRIRAFWLDLSEKERKELVRLEKETLLKKIKEHQRQTCTCEGCGRKRSAIEDELEMLFEAYYKELENFTNASMANGTFFGAAHSCMERAAKSLARQESTAVPSPPLPSFNESVQNNRNFIYEFATSLTAQGGVLSVADDFLSNDGGKFLDLMEQLAEKKMKHLEGGSDHDGSEEGYSDEEYEYDDEEGEGEWVDDDEDDEDDDEDYDEEDDYDLTIEERMEEGRRMFQIFAAKMFEQRVMNAYREKMAYERQQRLLEELEEEERLNQQREESRAKKQERKKAQKKLHKQREEELRLQKEREKQEAEEKRRLEKERKAEERRKRRELELQKELEMKMKMEQEEIQRRETEKARKLEEQRKAEEEKRKQAEEAARREKKLKRKEAAQARKAALLASSGQNSAESPISSSNDSPFAKTATVETEKHLASLVEEKLVVSTPQHKLMEPSMFASGPPTPVSQNLLSPAYAHAMHMQSPLVASLTMMPTSQNSQAATTHVTPMTINSAQSFTAPPPGFDGAMHATSRYTSMPMDMTARFLANDSAVLSSNTMETHAHVASPAKVSPNTTLAPSVSAFFHGQPVTNASWALRQAQKPESEAFSAMSGAPGLANPIQSMLSTSMRHAPAGLDDAGFARVPLADGSNHAKTSLMPGTSEKRRMTPDVYGYSARPAGSGGHHGIWNTQVLPSLSVIPSDLALESQYTKYLLDEEASPSSPADVFYSKRNESVHGHESQQRHANAMKPSAGLSNVWGNPLSESSGYGLSTGASRDLRSADHRAARYPWS